MRVTATLITASALLLASCGAPAKTYKLKNGSTLAIEKENVVCRASNDPSTTYCTASGIIETLSGRKTDWSEERGCDKEDGKVILKPLSPGYSHYLPCTIANDFGM